MRLLIGSILALAIAGILIAAFIIHPSTPVPAEIAQIKTTCTECHKVPVVRSAGSIHAAHPAVNCATCHTGGNTGRVDFNSCIPCHSVPAYTSSTALHDAHSTTECVVCHSDTAGLTAASNASNTLRSAAIGVAVLGLAGMVLNFIVTRIRLRK